MQNEARVPPAATAGMARRLAAILSADVKGYSRLMSEDEAATIRTLTAYRKMMTTLIQQHHGRVVDSPGDNLLAEFASVVDAVRCAVEIQHTLKAKNAALPDPRRMEFRIGINLGDVVVEGERLYGDGVNIAARLESLAEPGGVSLSGTVYEHVETKLALHYEYLGEQTVKNIPKPVQVWRVVMDDTAAALATQAVGQQPLRERPARGVSPTHRPWAIVAVAGLLLIAGTLVSIRYLSRPPLSPQSLVLSPQEALPLPDKPSIVILPFANLSGDPDQEYFSDGITEDLTTDLSQIPSLFVIARHSAFTYKGQAVKVQDVSRELGVRYVLEGSVRKADSQVRITAQLIDATTGYHLWAERYDRPLTAIFAVQDEVIRKITTALAVKLAAGEEVRLARFPTNNLEAYDHFLRGLESYYRFRKETNAQARQLFLRALELDPQYAAAYALLSLTYWTDWYSQWDPASRPLERAFETAQQAVTLDDSLATAHQILGMVLLWQKQYEHALIEAERAVVVNPNEADAYWALGFILNYVQRYQDALEAVEQAIRLNPHSPPYYLFDLGRAYRFLGQPEKAIAALKGALARNPNFLPARLQLAGVYGELAQANEAQAEVAEILSVVSPNRCDNLSPNFCENHPGMPRG
jgi:adenylate cyclase